VIVAAWPAARNPSTREPGISATISITGGIYLCAERTEKFGGGSLRITAAVATAVVSNPTRRGPLLRPSRAQCPRPGAGVDDVDRRAARLRIRQRLDSARHPEHVAERGHAHTLPRQHNSLIDLGDIRHADRTAGTHDDVERLREERSQSESRDGLLVAAADVHHGYGPPDLAHQAIERCGQRARQRGIAKLEIVGHAVPAISVRTSWSSDRRRLRLRAGAFRTASEYESGAKRARRSRSDRA